MVPSSYPTTPEARFTSSGGDVHWRVPAKRGLVGHWPPGRTSQLRCGAMLHQRTGSQQAHPGACAARLKGGSENHGSTETGCGHGEELIGQPRITFGAAPGYRTLASDRRRRFARSAVAGAYLAPSSCDGFSGYKRDAFIGDIEQPSLDVVRMIGHAGVGIVESGEGPCLGNLFNDEMFFNANQLHGHFLSPTSAIFTKEQSRRAG